MSLSLMETTRNMNKVGNLLQIILQGSSGAWTQISYSCSPIPRQSEDNCRVQEDRGGNARSLDWREEGTTGG